MKFRLAYQEWNMGDPMVQRGSYGEEEHYFDASSDDEAQAYAAEYLKHGEGRKGVKLEEVREISTPS